MTINDLEPKIVFRNFYGITRQPRPSKHEEKIRAYLLDWARQRGIEAFADEPGNVIMRVPATPGYENLKGVILQGHMDMVPQKNADVNHNFETDPIETWVDGDWLKAKGTTLGADDGLGLALAMSVLESKDLKHGPIELLATYDEETGMTGANTLKSGILHGDILINLDSETEGELYIGCAGGLDATATSTYWRRTIPKKGYVCYSLVAKGFKGGHSGLDINLYRANANKVAARLIYALIDKVGAKLVCMEGGTLRNAIPRECFSSLYIPVSKVRKAERTVNAVFAEIKAEYQATDPDCVCIFEPCDNPGKKYVDDDAALRFIRAIQACPNGVERMSDQMPGLVETSNNLAMVKIADGKFSVSCLLRGSVDSAKYQLGDRIEAVFTLAGTKVKFSGSYSGWAPNAASPILHTMKKVYTDMFGKEPAVVAVHAGLECGILSGAYPHWDMVSCGPTLMSPHSPDERAYIPSVQKMWDFLKAVLEVIPQK